jgi:hypothetical protein
MTPGSPSRRTEVAVAIATGVLGALAYFTGRLPFSNIDDYNVLPFQRGYLSALATLPGEASASGRFRPLYWALEGALGALTGPTATILHAGRLAFLAASVALLVLVARRLGAPLWYAIALGVASAWCGAAIDVWTASGPSEAFAQPLAVLAIWLALGARGAGGLAAAAAAGLAACLAKESYAPLVSATLLAHGAWSMLRPERRRLAGAAFVLAAVPFVPALVAWLGARRIPGSYLWLAVGGAGLTFGEMIEIALGRNVFPGLVALAGLAAAVARLARTRRSEWPLEDLLPLAATAAMGVVTIALRYAIPRYFLPLSTALLLLGARALPLRPFRGARIAGALAAAGVTVAVLAGGARAVTYARTIAATHRTDERLRNTIASVLAESGGAVIVWEIEDIERPVGAMAHLREQGRDGPVQIRTCSQLPPDRQALFDGMVGPLSRPLGRWAPMISSGPCMGERPPWLGERTCLLILPGTPEGPPGYRCVDVPEQAIVVGK